MTLQTVAPTEVQDCVPVCTVVRIFSLVLGLSYIEVEESEGLIDSN